MTLTRYHSGQVVHTAGAETVNHELFKTPFTRAYTTPNHSRESNQALGEKDCSAWFQRSSGKKLFLL